MKSKRCGVTLLETVLALCLLAAAFVAAAQMLTVCARQRVEAERQLAAQLEADNAAERIAAMSYESLTPDHARLLALTPEGQAALAGGELAVELTAPDGQPTHKRVTLDVSWPSAVAERHHMRLVTWKYAPREAAQ